VRQPNALQFAGQGRRQTLGADITKTNNTQNRIENRDFVSLDPEQNRIKTELAIEKIEYHVIRSESLTRSETAFDLTESTTAAACASDRVHLVVQFKREIGKLWENIEKAPYKELFNSTVTGMYIWRCVQVQRKIDARLEAILKSLGVDSGRDSGIAVHRNRLIAMLVFRILDSKQFLNANYPFETSTSMSSISMSTEAYYGKLRDQVAIHYGNAIISRLFKNLSSVNTWSSYLTE